MAEKLGHPGFYRRFFLGEVLGQETKVEIGEYKALRIDLNLGRHLRIYYPASGTDISPSYGFPGSDIFYSDNNPVVCNTLRNGKMPFRKRSRMTIIEGNALDPANQPRDIDIAIIRNRISGVETDKLASALTSPVKEGGYVIAGSWGSSAVATELAQRDNMRMIGYLARHHGYQALLNEDLHTVRDNLIRNKNEPYGAYPGRTFVFQKIKPQH